jgi:hypothetical protein
MLGVEFELGAPVAIPSGDTGVATRRKRRNERSRGLGDFEWRLRRARDVRGGSRSMNRPHDAAGPFFRR